MPRSVVCAIAANVVLLAPAARGGAADCGNGSQFLDYLYVEANEGGSSGGHVALRLGDVVYHWQNEGDGLLRLSRRDPVDFLYEYAVLENRSLHLSRIAVTADTFERLRAAFQRRWLDESVAAEGLLARRADRELLEALLAAHPGDADGDGARVLRVPLRVPAAGLFLSAAERKVSEGADPGVAALAERIAREHGADFAQRRAAVLRKQIADSLGSFAGIRGEVPGGAAGRVAEDPGDPVDLRGGAGRAAAWQPQSSLASDLVDHSAALLALDVLYRARPIAPSAHHAPGSEELRLGEDERRALAAYADRLEQEMAALVASEHPGAGVALLVGVARLAALRQSVDSGRLVVLDAYPDGATQVSGARLERHRSLLPGILAEAYAALRASRERFARDSSASERSWTEVETAANRAVELERAAAGGSRLRVAPAPFVPLRSAEIELEMPAPPRALLATAHEHAREGERRWQAEVKRRFGYRLLTQNCVTEIFRVVDQTLAVPGAVSAGESEIEQRLGGSIAPLSSLHFVPAVAALAVRRGWHAVEERSIPSIGDRLRAEAGRRGALTALRERSPLTSRLHAYVRWDSLFLFFTEDAPWLRPLLGAANLVTGLGGAVAGLALLPFDGADTLVAGLRGVLFSVPELGFINIRKGAFEWVPLGDRPVGLARELEPSEQVCAAAYAVLVRSGSEPSAQRATETDRLTTARPAA